MLYHKKEYQNAQGLWRTRSVTITVDQDEFPSVTVDRTRILGTDDVGKVAFAIAVAQDEGLTDDDLGKIGSLIQRALAEGEHIMNEYWRTRGGPLEVIRDAD